MADSTLRQTQGREIPADEQTEIVTIEEAMRRLEISKSTVYEGMRLGRIPSITVGEKRKVIPRAAFERWMELGDRMFMQVTTLQMDIKELARELRRAELEATIEAARRELDMLDGGTGPAPGRPEPRRI